MVNYLEKVNIKQPMFYSNKSTDNNKEPCGSLLFA